MIRDQLNKEVAQQGLHFAPDPAIQQSQFWRHDCQQQFRYKSVLYGKTSDHVISLKVMLTNGDVVEFSKLSAEQYEQNVRAKQLKPPSTKAFANWFLSMVMKSKPGIPRLCAG